MFKKSLTLSICALTLTAFSFSMGKTDFMETAIEKIKTEVQKSRSFNEKALCYQNLEKWYQLLVKLNIPNEEKTEILLRTKENMDYLREEYQDFPEYFFKDEKNAPLTLVLDGREIVVFKNLDEKRYADEVESYKEHKNFDPIEVTKDTLQDLKIETHYNYVIMPDGKFICAELQEYDELFTPDKKKILLAPNHALLAEGKPVIAAGELKIIGRKDFPVYWIGTTSGHYHPDLETRKHIENKLIELGVPSEQIVTLGFHFNKLPWKIVEGL